MAGDVSLTLIRPADLLRLEFELVNLEISPDWSRLDRTDEAAEALVIVHFPPQALAEEVWTGAPADPPIRTALSGPSRLVFRLPGNGGLPLTTEALLDWTTWTPVVAPAALPRDTSPAPDIGAPAPAGPLETAIEFPWRLTLSPDQLGRWRTATTAAGSTGTHELWGAVLYHVSSEPPVAGVPAGVSQRIAPDVRALARFTGAGELPTSLNDDDRGQVVSLTADFHLPVPDANGSMSDFTPVPLRAGRLELTMLGANAELEGAWDYPLIPGPPPDPPPDYTAIGLRSYQHTAAQGRDHFARTVRVGYLCGTGHRAVIVSATERLPAGADVVGETPAGALFGARGYLLKPAEVTVQEPVVDYTQLAAAFANEGREFPLARIAITTKSARIQPMTPDQADAIRKPFWLANPDGSPLMFHAVGTDVSGQSIEFALPLMFVPYEALGEHEDIRGYFNNPPAGFTNPATIELAGQSMAFAQADDKPGSTLMRTQSLTYALEQPPGTPGQPAEEAMNPARVPPSYLPRFLMRVSTLTASAPAIDDLLGTTEPVEFRLDRSYLSAGFDPAANRAQTFLGWATDLPLSLPTQKGGGLATPSATVNALSRTVGPVAVAKPAEADPVDLSAFGDTKVLGTIAVRDLLPALPAQGLAPVFDSAAGAEPTPEQLEDQNCVVDPPRLTTRRLPEGAPVPEEVVTRFVWKPALQSLVGVVLTLDLTGAPLLLEATTRLVRGSSPSLVVRGRLRGAQLTFAGALAAKIDELSFRAESGRKLEAGASNVHITFLGPLAFVNALQSILPADGFDDPPYVTADAQGVVAGYTLGVPSVEVGLFSIQNIAVSAALSIPFTDRPAGIRFAICERHKPFLVTVSLFGGGGFFAVGVSASGIEEVEASLEFGGNISLNLVVASGGVHVMAGIYFGMKGSSVELTGYLRCGGSLEVLGLISISVEFYLAFTYRNKEGGGNEVWGQATLTVAVKIAFFSTSVELSVERRFAGSDGDPSFADTVRPLEWARYLQAFA